MKEQHAKGPGAFGRIGASAEAVAAECADEANEQT
jgi:hypothetical protein